MERENAGEMVESMGNVGNMRFVVGARGGEKKMRGERVRRQQVYKRRGSLGR